jgi:hypothetical protein
LISFYPEIAAFLQWRRMRTLMMLALFCTACALGRQKQLATEAEVKKKVANGEKSSDGRGKFTCETMTLVGTHVPKTYCYYKDEEQEEAGAAERGNSSARDQVRFTSLHFRDPKCPASCAT